MKKNIVFSFLMSVICMSMAQSQEINSTYHSAIREKSFALNLGLNSMDCNLHTITYGGYIGGEYIYQRMDGLTNRSRAKGLKVGGMARFSAYKGSESEEKYGRSYSGLYISIGGDIGYSYQIGKIIVQPTIGPQLIMPLAVAKDGLDAGDIDAGYGVAGSVKIVLENNLSLDMSLTRFSNDLDPYGDINESSQYQVTYNFAVGVSKSFWVRPVQK